MMRGGILLAALLASACGRDAARSPAPAPASVTVTTGRVETARTPRFLPLAGTVRPTNHATLSARVAGVVSGTPPGLGTRVAAGDVLVVLAAAEVEARLNEARATLAQVDRELAREQRLLEDGASAAEDVRTLEDRRRASAAAVDEAAALSSYRTIAAPFDGVVTDRFVEEGDLASPGTPLLELEGTDRLRVEVQVPESLAAPALGAQLSVETDGASLPGRLSEISPAADPASRTRLAKIELPPSAPLHSGQYVRVLWPAGTEEALFVPSDAVTRFGQMERVFVVSGDRAQLRLVRTADTAGDATRILSGLESGETVVRQPPAGLADGTPLDVRP